MNHLEKNMLESFSSLLDNWISLYQQAKTPEIIAKIVHEVKNPLSLVRSTLQLIEVQTPEVKENKHWNSLFDELDYICLLLNDFKTLNCTYDIQRTDVNLGTLLDSVAAYFYSSAYNKNIDFYLTKPQELPIIIGDKIRLQEALMNLIKNAMEATDRNGTVSIDAKHLDSLILITINDTGAGISDEQLEQIFQPFVTYKENGTGLGLPIVKAIIEQHGGNIDVTSTFGEGTSFIISLPIDSQQPLQVQQFK